MRYMVAADTGGTFTDVAVYDAVTQSVSYSKTLTDYTHLVDGVLDGLSGTEVSLSESLLFKHGTTHVINTFLRLRASRIFWKLPEAIGLCPSSKTIGVTRP